MSLSALRPHAPRRLETELLLLAARPPRAEDDARVGALLEHRIDWAALLWLAHRQGLLPLLEARLADQPDAPRGVLEQLTAHAASNRRAVARTVGEAADLTAMLRGRGIEVLALRTPALQAAVYASPGLRQIEPLDLLVAPRHADRAGAALVDAGYRSVYPVTPAREAALRRARGAAVLHHDERGVRLHLHDRLGPSYFPLGLEPDDLIRRAQPLALQSGAAPGPAPEDLLLLLALHGAAQCWGRLALVADVAWLLRTPLAWDAALERARASRIERMVLLALSLVEDVLGAPIPSEARRRIDADPEVAVLTASARRRLLEDFRGRTGEMERSRFRAHTRENAVDRARYWLGFATTPAVEDWAAVYLPDALFPLYHLVRPARLALALAMGSAEQQRAPFVPSPMPLVERMLTIADVRRSDVVYDLGCGDGRIVIEAARRYGARGVGVDLDPARIAESRANAREAGVEHLVSFIQADASEVDLSEATIVTLWTLPALNLQLRPKLRAELRPGTRVVGHSFDMGDWAPSRTEIVSYGDEMGVAYVWTIGATANSAPAPALAPAGVEPAVGA